jgi:hypothetical protein
LELNPAFDACAIATACVEDSIALATEYGVQFRSDVDTSLSPDPIGVIRVLGRRKVTPHLACPGTSTFVDRSGGLSPLM